MALNNEYFDSINIEVVKRKYYNSNKVEAVLKDIRAQALAMAEENAELKARVAVLERRKDDIGEALLTAKDAAATIIRDAEEKAAAIIRDAEEEKERVLGESRQSRKYSVLKVEECYSSLRKMHMDCIESINSYWQDFLANLPDDGIELESLQLAPICDDEDEYEEDSSYEPAEPADGSSEPAVAEELVVTAKDAVPVIEEPAVTVEEPATVVEEPAIAYEPVVAVEELAPVIEEPTPVVKEPVTAAEKSAPAVREPEPYSNRTEYHVPADISERVNAIAREILAMGSFDDE